MAKKSLRSQPQQRLYSLDVLRGFDMFWITGGGYLVVLLSRMTGATWLEAQMEHAQWAGFHFEDLIFPMFMFISGVAITFSVKSKLQKNVSKKKLLGKVFKRLVLLFVLGLLYNGAFQNGFANARIASVLAQIGVGYFFASLIVIYFESFRSRIIWVVGILVGYGVLQLLVPVPGFGAGVLDKTGSINSYIDQLFLPGRLYETTYDPEGILCSLSATGITLLGTIAGNILRRKKTTDWQKIGYLVATGVGLIILALLFSSFYPIIKRVWTSTFNMLAGGISFILLALFFLIIDHWKFQKWAFYFRVIGMNSIFVYLFRRIINIYDLSGFFVGWIAKPLGKSGELVIAIGALAVVWLVLYFMYRKKVFLRV